MTEELEKTVQSILENPETIASLDKVQLAEVYGTLNTMLEELDSAKSVVKDSIFSQMDTDSEEIGDYIAMKVKKPVFKELTLDKAKDLGLTKVEEAIDQSLVKRAWKNGADVGKVEFEEMNVMRRKKCD